MGPPARPRRLAPLLCLAALSALGCARDFSVPQPDEDGPAHLGDLAGYYTLSLVAPSEGAGPMAWPPTSAPYQLATPMLLQHLPLPEAEGDVLSGLLSGMAGPAEGSASCEIDADQLGAARLFARLRDQEIVGQLSLRGARTLAAGVVMAGRRDLAFNAAVCASGQRLTLLASRGCHFDPALSGVYASGVPGCEGEVEGTRLALGFLDLPGAGTFVSGIEWRRDAAPRSFIGAYDRFAELGAGAFLDELSTRAPSGVTALRLSQQGALIRAEAATATQDLRSCQGGGCDQCIADATLEACGLLGACESAPAATAADLAGCLATAGPEEACVPAAPQGLYASSLGVRQTATGPEWEWAVAELEGGSWRLITGDDRRGLYGLLIPTDPSEPTLVARPGAELCQATHDGLAGAPQDHVGLSFPLPAKASGGSYTLLVFGVFEPRDPKSAAAAPCAPARGDHSQALSLAAPPACLTLPAG